MNSMHEMYRHNFVHYNKNDYGWYHFYYYKCDCLIKCMNRIYSNKQAELTRVTQYYQPFTSDRAAGDYGYIKVDVPANIRAKYTYFITVSFNHLSWGQQLTGSYNGTTSYIYFTYYCPTAVAKENMDFTVEFWQ